MKLHRIAGACVLGMLLLTVSAGVCLAAESPKATVFGWNDGGATVAALREAGMDAAQAPPLTPGAPLALEGMRLVVLTADAALSDEQGAQMAAFVRAGGGLLVLHTCSDNPNYWWETYRRTGKGEPHPSPLWDALPFVSVPVTEQTNGGLRNPFGPTRVLRQAQSPLLAGVDLTQAPIFPYHSFMVLPTHPIVQGAHVMLAWSEDQYKSALWGNGQVLAWGDDPEQRPLLISAEYGAGRCAAAAVPLFDKSFMQWPGSRVLVKNLTAWLTSSAQQVSPVMAENKIYGIGLPWLVRDSLQRMGLTITARAEEASGAIVYAQPTADQAKALAALARANKPVVVANPDALRVSPLNELVPVSTTPAPAGAPPAPAPKTVISKTPLANDWKMLVGTAWAQDPEDVGEAQKWFTAQGAAAVKWQAAAHVTEAPKAGSEVPHPKLAVQGKIRTPQKAEATANVALQGPPAAGEPAKLSWTKSYRWRLEGSMLDRSDLIEGWEQPSLNDSAWAEQAMGQQPPPPTVAGVTARAPSLMAGALWARAHLTLSHPEASRGWLTPSSTPKFVTLLDGKPLRQPVALRTLTAGEHLVALRVWPLQHPTGDASAQPWGSGMDKLQWPEVVDSPWLHCAAEKGEADGFFAGYHSEWLSGDPTQPTGGSPGWYQVRLDAQRTYLPLKISDAPETRAGTVVWLDGQRLGTAPQIIDLPRLPPGTHVLTLLKNGSEELAVAPRANLWFKATVRLTAGDKWNALKIDNAPAKAVLYVNGREIAQAPTGVIRIPWKTGDNLLVWGNLEQQLLPASRMVQAPAEPAAAEVPAPERLQGVWYRREGPDHQALAQGWPAGLNGATPPDGWTAIAAGATPGEVTTVRDEQPRWFAAPFQVSAREAAGPARLVIDTTGDAVPMDLIKDVWVNGQRVPARLEFASTQRYEMDRGKETTISFIVSGRLKAGLNWLAFPLDFQEYLRLRLAMPSEQGKWAVPLLKLDFSGNLDSVTWSQPLARLDGGGLVHRGQTVALPAGASVLARFSDGAPAVARVGSITFATSDQSRDWSRWIEDSLRYDWIVLKNGDWHYGYGTQLRARNHASGQPVLADGAQVPMSLLRGAPVILGAEPAADGGAVIRLAPAKEPRLLNYQIRNWMGMVLSEGRVTAAAGATQVSVPAPAADPSPTTTRLRGDRWLRVALLEGSGQGVADYLEARVDGRPPVEVLLSPTDGAQRDLPGTIPGAAPSYDPFNHKWSLAANSPANPVVVAGERIEVRAMCRNTTDKPQQVALDLAWEGALESKPVAVRGLRFTLAPYEQRTELIPCGFRVSDMGFSALPSNDPVPLRLVLTGQQPVSSLASGRVVARAGNAVVSELALIAVRPWKEFAPNSTHKLPGQWGSPGGFGMEQFDKTASLETLSDPKHRWYGSEASGMWCSAIDWWRDYFMNTRGTGGGFGGFSGKKGFAWGAFDDVYDNTLLTIDNASYMPDGTQYQEMLYASISREYNRAMHGSTQPLIMAIADYWGNFGMPSRERNDGQFLRYMREHGRPLNVANAEQLKALRLSDPTVGAAWQRFAVAARVAWCRQFMAGMPPHSINFSQGESVKFLFGRAFDNFDAIRAALDAANSAIFQPLDIAWRGELHFGWMRAMDPNVVVRNDFWYQTTGHSQSLGGNGHGISSSAEWAQLMTLDNGLMAIRDNAGRIQPLINSPINDEILPERGRTPLFSGGRHESGSVPSELLARDATYHLCALIQPERLLGSYVVTPLERVADNKLDGTTVKFRGRVDNQSIMSLVTMLRNYGALWGGVIAPDRLDKIQPGEGALYLMPSGAGDAEAKSLVDLVRRGGSASIFFSTGGTKTHETPLSDLFGVKFAPLAEGIQGGIVLPDKGQRAVPPSDNNLPQYVAARAGQDVAQGAGGFANRALLREVEAGKGRATFSALNCEANWTWDHDLARELAKAVNWASGNPVTLPDGVGGYAFEAKGLTFLVLEDLKYTGGPATIHLRLPAGRYLAADLFTGQPVKVEAQNDGVILHPTLQPNGGNVIAVRKLEQ